MTSLTFLSKLEKLQASIERQQGIQRKWAVVSSLYKEVLACLNLKQGCQLLKKLHHLAAERIFGLEMRKKYADGQAIAKKLNKELTKITASVKLLIPQLKALRTAQFGDLSDEAANDNDDVDDVSIGRDETEDDENEHTDNLDQ
ncbi:hypothetical protein AWC38_SpisGene23421 [Stylophora pistillata]|uniref:Uncharacterized protein n=1 Tax=Stylophora pistillata TaxID=50429 RepID=A0A2B4R2M4_STYPI|nr:hypothetical protein AWC38_SpisGene23421 [Stylophora pistillata]